MIKKVSDKEILWAKVKYNAKIPAKSKENAGYDIYACFDDDFIVIPYRETKLIPTGLACALNENYYLQLEERGSTGSKGIKISSGVIDSGYRGEIFAALTNCADRHILISKLTPQQIYERYPKRLISIDNERDVCINDAVFYPYKKAICQGIVHIVPDLESREVTYDELKSFCSERGEGSLGSSGK